MTDTLASGPAPAAPQDANLPGDGLPDAVARRLEHLFRRSRQTNDSHPLLALMQAYRARSVPTEPSHD